jgi:transcriptional regulator with XRE-family HTH domain
VALFVNYNTIMPRTTSRKKSPVALAVANLRGKLGDSQQDFAQRLGVSITTVAKYETSNPPTGSALVKLADMARASGASGEEMIMRLAYAAELKERDGVSAEWWDKLEPKPFLLSWQKAQVKPLLDQILKNCKAALKQAPKATQPAIQAILETHQKLSELLLRTSSPSASTKATEELMNIMLHRPGAFDESIETSIEAVDPQRPE